MRGEEGGEEPRRLVRQNRVIHRKLFFVAALGAAVAATTPARRAEAGDFRLGLEGGGGVATHGDLTYEGHLGALLMYRPVHLFELGAYGTLHGATVDQVDDVDFGLRAQFISGGFRYGVSAGYFPAGGSPYQRHGFVWGLHAGFPELYRSESVAVGLGTNLAFVQELPAFAGTEFVRLAFLLTVSIGPF